jgi:hypothetical protein
MDSAEWKVLKASIVAALTTVPKGCAVSAFPLLFSDCDPGSTIVPSRHGPFTTVEQLLRQMSDVVVVEEKRVDGRLTTWCSVRRDTTAETAHIRHMVQRQHKDPRYEKRMKRPASAAASFAGRRLNFPRGNDRSDVQPGSSIRQQAGLGNLPPQKVGARLEYGYEYRWFFSRYQR